MIARSAAGVTVVVSDVVLSPVSGSPWSPVTLAVFVWSPVEVATTAIVTVAVSPLAMLPMSQMTVPVHVPRVAADDTKLISAGSVSVSITPVASEGPLLLTLMV